MANLDFDGLIRRHLEAANQNDFDAMDELFDENYVLELPQSGERIKGKTTIRDLHVNYPAKVHFVTRRVIGHGELAVWEGTISYNDGAPMNRVAIFEFRDGKITRETDYFGDPFPAPDWRAKYAERMS
jgi:ketosteroid isomerase-like protein